MAQATRRGILASFSAGTQTASVIIVEATSTYLNNVPCATSLNASNAIPGADCCVLFYDENNSDDAVVLAVYNTNALAIDSGANIFVTGVQQITASVINAGVTTTFTVTNTAGIPSGATGIIFKVFWSSPTIGAFIQIAPTGATIGNYFSSGNLTVANQTINTVGIVPVSTNGQIDIKASTGNCTINLYTFGYIAA